MKAPTRLNIERKLRAVLKQRAAARKDLQHLSTALLRQELEVKRLDAKLNQFEAELVAVIGPVQEPAVKPPCWCCSCKQQSSKHEGCKACWVRRDVQDWIDLVPQDQMAEDHKTGYTCPHPDRLRCPGWEPRKA